MYLIHFKVSVTSDKKQNFEIHLTSRNQCEYMCRKVVNIYIQRILISDSSHNNIGLKVIFF